MGARFAAGTDALAALVRENQDLIALARDRDKALIAAMSNPGQQQDRAAIARMRQDIADSHSKLAALAARLEKEFPDYAALTSPKPLAAENAQRLLGPDEVLAFWMPARRRPSFSHLLVLAGSKRFSAKAGPRRGCDASCFFRL